MRKDFLVAVPFLALAVILQTSIISRINLLNGQADLLLLIVAAWSLQERVRGAWIWGLLASGMVAFVSGVPWYIYLVSYLAIVGFARLLARRVWQAPLLAMFTVTFMGTLVLLMLTYFERTLVEGVSLGFNLAFLRVILPGVLLNMLWAIPVNALVQGLAKRLHPAEAIS